MVLFLVINRVHANEEIAKLLARKIVCYRKQDAVSGHESNCRPTVTIVANVDVGSLGIVAADRNEISVEQRQVFDAVAVALPHPILVEGDIEHPM